MSSLDRLHLKFAEKVREAFKFLDDMGFSEIEALPTLVRYRKGRIEVDIYHGRQSYEIEIGVTGHGERYSISEIIRAINPEIAERYRNATATTQDEVIAGLAKLSSLMKRYGDKALQGDLEFFALLEHQRSLWSEEYALDVLAEQLRPQANEAFRKGDYASAADLYSRILRRLSPAELKKLDIAEGRRKS